MIFLRNLWRKLRFRILQLIWNRLRFEIASDLQRDFLGRWAWKQGLDFLSKKHLKQPNGTPHNTGKWCGPFPLSPICFVFARVCCKTLSFFVLIDHRGAFFRQKTVVGKTGECCVKIRENVWIARAVVPFATAKIHVLGLRWAKSRDPNRESLAI